MTARLRIEFRDGQTAFQPGDIVHGIASWELDVQPQQTEARLFWFTEGRGTRDVEIVNRATWPRPAQSDSREFSFQLPASPYSFSGSLITLVWAVELIALPSEECVHAEFVMAPEGREVQLPRIVPDPFTGFESLQTSGDGDETGG